MQDMVFYVGDNTIQLLIDTGAQGVGFKRDKFVGDGAETDFTCTYTPVRDSLELLLNGVPQEIDVDFTLSGKVITFTTAPEDTWKIEAKYAYGTPIVYSTAPDYEVEQFDGSALTANQRSGAADILTQETFKENSLLVFRNQILQKRGTNYDELVDRTGITQITALETDDEIEYRYVKE